MFILSAKGNGLLGLGLQDVHDFGNLLEHLGCHGRRLFALLHGTAHAPAVSLVVVAQLENGLGAGANLLHDGHLLEARLCLEAESQRQWAAVEDGHRM